MARIGKIKADAAKASGGVWIDYEEGIRLRVARMGNPAFQEFVRAKQGANLRGFRAKRFNVDAAQALTKEAVAHHVLVDWENIEDDAGATIPYSPEKALEFFNDPALADLYNFVVVAASDAEAYRLETEEETRGN